MLYFYKLERSNTGPFVYKIKLNQHQHRMLAIKRSKLGPTYVYCNISISHGGKNDIDRHVKTQKHSNNAQCLQGVRQMDSFVNISATEDKVTESEC